MDKRRSPLAFLRWMALLLIVAAVGLAVLKLHDYQQIKPAYPAGSVIAGIPVGGLSHAQAADRVAQAYALPLTEDRESGWGIKRNPPRKADF